MKPIKLKITGLNSFIQTQEINFEELGKDNLFCISGSTGSGKTTIVDAIILALYGETKRGNLPDIINLSSQKAVVELTIELEGEEYIIVREIRRKSGNIAKVYKASGELIADGITQADSFISSKVVLEKEQFTKVVMLQQGEFDKFLSDKRTDRMKVIEKLTDISKYQKAIELIKTDERNAKNELDNSKMMLETYADVSDAVLLEKKELLRQLCEAESSLVKQKEERGKALDEMRKKLDAYKLFAEREDKLKTAKSEIEKLEKEYAKLSEDKEKSTTYRENLDKIAVELASNGQKREEISGYVVKASSLKDITVSINRAVSEYKQTEIEKTAKEKELSVFRTRLAEIKEKYAFLEEQSKEIAEKTEAEYNELYAIYNNQRLIRENIAREEAQLKKEESALKVKSVTAEHTEKYKNECTEEALNLKSKVEQHELILDKLRTDDALGLVLSTAKVGDVCPICGNVITTLSHVEQGGSIAEATQLLKKTKDAYEVALNKLKKAESAHASAISEYESAKKNIEAILQRITSLKASLGEEITAPQLSLSKDRARSAKDFDQLILQIKTLEDIVEDKNKELKKRKADGEQLREQERELKAMLIEKCSTADVAEIEKIIQTLREKDKELEAQKAKLEAYLKTVSDREIELVTALAHKRESYESLKKEHTYCEKIDKTAVEALAKELQDVDLEILKSVEARSALTTRIADIEKRLEAKKELEKEHAEKEKRYGNLKELKDLVKGDAFTDFVADAFIEEITADASARMSDLSSGQYTLFYNDGAFYVKDYFSAGESRNVTTLSGGERFLASLSLAIAISRRTAQSRDYGFFFIDEGFGTLDGNAIETVCASLEALALDTVVGVITHRGELIERIPSVLHVSKADGENGSICTVK